jgi:Ser/Thr protein kinase RdoA (MazF antagonist)
MQSVDRPVGPNSNFVHEFLRHLALSGFNGSPKFFGTDERGREILSFVEGDVPPELGYYSDGDLVKAAQLIRRFHEHSRSFPRKGPHEIVCHNNLSPCNFVFRDGPIAIIDFDAAAWLAPWDVSYAAWLWLDIGNEDYSPYHQAGEFVCSVRPTGATLANSWTA